MAKRSPPHRGRALIVEDEILFAINLEADMHALGFEVCDLAANGQQASMLAMSNQPDVVLMDINLEGGREGIEIARWLHKVCKAPIVFITGRIATPSSVSTNRYREHRCCPSRSTMTALPTPWQQLARFITDPSAWRKP